jgi:aldose 1-epimerase
VKLEQTEFGRTPNGQCVHRFLLANRKGVSVKIITYGGIIAELEVPDNKGCVSNVVLGFDNLAAYLNGHPHFGAIAGRVANRIAQGKFTLDGQNYQLDTNNGPNHLHGGREGFDKKVWEARPMPTAEKNVGVKLSYFSPAGEEGYPGNLKVEMVYTLNDNNEFGIEYKAVTDQATLINLTNHSYFNLAGAGDILNHQLTIDADRYTPADETLIPSGVLAPVAGTPLDFLAPHALGERIEQLKPNPGGYDHNFVLNKTGGKRPVLAARATDPQSGRTLEVLTTEPGIQLYTGNFLDGSLRGATGMVYGKHSGFCLETQHFPDAINHPEFPSVVLRPGEKFHSRTLFRFGW